MWIFFSLSQVSASRVSSGPTDVDLIRQLGLNSPTVSPHEKKYEQFPFPATVEEEDMDQQPPTTTTPEPVGLIN